ncbi:MAG TPA: bifunctional adenosylcobinamide kinase/adenosylcobinamide-phosphate guanylyltransferase [Steroidobacteraceae bacterium]
MKTLVIGGARSGKSTHATQLARERASDVCAIVTATASDPEMAARIAAHRAARPAHWHVREEPVRLGAALREEGERHALLLIDCLTLWTANCLWAEATPDPDTYRWQRELQDFLEALQASSRELIIVTNEVGTGIVPENAAARLFRDEHGWLNQKVAALCEQVVLVVAGIATRIK